jgi:hypothetical protein
MRNQQRRKRDELLCLYRTDFQSAGLPLPANWQIQVLRMFRNPIASPLVMPPRPPSGWLALAQALGGLPHELHWLPHWD